MKINRGKCRGTFSRVHIKCIKRGWLDQCSSVARYRVFKLNRCILMSGCLSRGASRDINKKILLGIYSLAMV